MHLWKRAKNRGKTENRTFSDVFQFPLKKRDKTPMQKCWDTAANSRIFTMQLSPLQQHTNEWRCWGGFLRILFAWFIFSHVLMFTFVLFFGERRKAHKLCRDMFYDMFDCDRCIFPFISNTYRILFLLVWCLGSRKFFLVRCESWKVFWLKNVNISLVTIKTVEFLS